jgi:retron-type reverse transcriptase
VLKLLIFARVQKLIRQLLKAGYVENWRFHKTYSGVPQGSVIGPLLANLVLNELDQWVEKELIPQHNRGTERGESPEYRRISYAMTKARWDSPEKVDTKISEFVYNTTVGGIR